MKRPPGGREVPPATPDWEREFEVDADAVRRAAGSPGEWRLLGVGWDCDAWLADESVVWRVPRRDAGIDALGRETAVLPRIAPYLPFPVPVPVAVAAEGLPLMARHAHIPGRELAGAPDPPAALGASLGRFLRALHDPALLTVAGDVLPRDPLERGDPGVRIPRAMSRLAQVGPLVDLRPLREIIERAAGPPLAATAVCHGDLHPRHVMVDDAGELTGVIDWGDSCIASPAIDLAIVTALDADGRRAFFDDYGRVDAASWRHARMLAVMLGASLLAADPNGTSGRAALGWLERLGREG